MKSALVLLSCLGFSNGFAPIANTNTNTNTNTHPMITSTTSSRTPTALNQLKVSGMWTNGNSFGKGQFKFYKSQSSWMSPFPDEDRALYPELFSLPKGVYEVSMLKPLGIVFEEVEIGRGVFVLDLVEGGNADRMGAIQIDDILIGVTAIKVVGAKWERRMIPAKDLSFDTIVDAIGSNSPQWGCDDVVLQFMRPSEVEDMKKVDEHLAFYNPPGDSSWRTA